VILDKYPSICYHSSIVQNAQIVPDEPIYTGGIVLKLSKKDIWFLSKRIVFSIVLPVLAICSLAWCTDWSDPDNGPSSAKKEHMKSCVYSQRELGDRFLMERPDCKTYVSKPAAVRVGTH
jgi:hypothetical protein